MSTSPKWHGFDIETSGTLEEYALQPWRMQDRTAWITSLVRVGKDSLDELGFKPQRHIIHSVLCSHAGHNFVGANTVFDVAWMLALGLRKEVFEINWWDFQLIWKRVDPWRYSYGLKEAVAKFLPEYAGYEDDVDYHSEDPEEIKKLIRYNIRDSAYTLKIFNILWAQLSKEEQIAAKIEAAGIPYIAESWLHGIELDSDNLDMLMQTTYEQKDTLVNDIMKKYDLEENIETIIASPKKLARLLYEDWEIPCPKRTEAGNPSTDKEVLIRLAVDYEEADQIRRIRNANTVLSKFVEAPIESKKYNNDHRTHPNPRIAGTYTGRMTYASKQGKTKKTERQTGIALHQWQRDRAVRNSLKAPQGYMLVEFDWAGQEMRLMADRVAVLTGDTAMVDLFNQGIDMHGYMGASIAHIDYDYLIANKEGECKQDRYLGKFANLSLQYRVGIDTMMVRALTNYDLWLTRQEATKIKRTYLRTFQGVERYWEAAIRIAREQGGAWSLGNRFVSLDNLREYPQQQTAINFPIQGTGADMKQLGIAVIGKKLLKMGGMYAFDLHDALFLYIPITDDLQSNCLELQHDLNHLPYTKAWGWEPTLELPVDGSIGPAWGSMTDIQKWEV